MLTNAFSLLVIIVFAAWTFLTILNQHRSTRRFILAVVRRDLCCLIPIWTFFAPNPGRTDIHLLYRDRDADGRMTAWREVPLDRRRSWLMLWNPRRRICKGVTDVAPDLTRDTTYKPKEVVSKRKVFTFPYLLLLNYVCCQPVDFRARLRQFAVARTNGIGAEGEVDVAFLSAFHRIEPTSSQREESCVLSLAWPTDSLTNS